MELFITILVVLNKAFIDFMRWPFTNHWIGFVAVSVVMLGLCYLTWEIYPVFLFNVLFNPTLNVMKGMPFFYVGTEADTDKFLRKLFDKWAGQVWFFCNLVLLILTL